MGFGVEPIIYLNTNFENQPKMGKSSRKRKSSVKSAQTPEQENERNGEAKQSIEEKISELQSEKILPIIENREPESLARVVSQALQAGHVSHVTVTKLPAEAVLPLLAVIETNFQNGKVSGPGPAVWLKSLLESHAGYLMSLPDFQHVLSSLYSLLGPRTSHLNPTLQLAGKLEMLDKQVMRRNRTDHCGERQEKSLLSYQDD